MESEQPIKWSAYARYYADVIFAAGIALTAIGFLLLTGYALGVLVEGVRC